MSIRTEKFWFRIYRLGAWFFASLPRPIALAVASAAGWIAAAISSKKRRVVAANLRHVLGPAVSERRLDQVVRASFVAYARYWAASVHHEFLSDEALSRVLVVEQLETFNAAIEKNKGVILAIPHLGSWELGGIWARSTGLSITVAVEPAPSKEMEDWFAKRREAVGISVVPLGQGSAIRLLSALRTGGIVALLCDRDITGDGVEVEFFGARTRLPAGPAVLALRSGAPLLSGASYLDPSGLHHFVFGSIIDTTRSSRFRDDVRRITQDVAYELEKFIAVAPEQWHVFQPNWPEEQENRTVQPSTSSS